MSHGEARSVSHGEASTELAEGGVHWALLLSHFCPSLSSITESVLQDLCPDPVAFTALS